MEPSKESTKKRGAERPGLLLKRIDEAARAITAAPLAEREAAVLRRDTPPRTILALARFNRTEPDLLQTIATSRRWLGFYDIVQALCFNPRTPTRGALPLLQRLYPLDLTKLLGQVRLPPPLRTAAGHLLRTRVEGLSPGERLGLARNARGPALALLLSIETAARVREALLASPGLREMDVLQFITGNKTTSEALGQVGKDRRWSRRARVRALLAQRPETPPDVALTLIESLPLQELKPIVRDERISPVVRLVARRWLEEKQRQGPFAPSPEPNAEASDE